MPEKPGRLTWTHAAAVLIKRFFSKPRLIHIPDMQAHKLTNREFLSHPIPLC